MRFFLLLLIGQLLGCATHVPMTTSAPDAATVPFLALGDSYTIGEGAAAAERWPVQLVALAKTQGLALAEPDIIARTGWTTAELQEAIRAAGNHRTYAARRRARFRRPPRPGVARAGAAAAR